MSEMHFSRYKDFFLLSYFVTIRACVLNLFGLYLEAQYHLALAESFEGYGKSLSCLVANYAIA